MKNSEKSVRDTLMKIYGQSLIADANGNNTNYSVSLSDMYHVRNRLLYYSSNFESKTIVDWNGMQGHFMFYVLLYNDFKNAVILNSSKKMNDWCKSLWNTLVFEKKKNIKKDFINKSHSYYKKPGDINIFLSLFNTQQDVHDCWNKLETDQILVTNCNITLKSACIIDEMSINYIGFSKEESKRFKLFFYRKGPYKYQHMTSRIGFKDFAQEISDPITFEKKEMQKEWKKRSRK